jgi:putative peptide zinc metalloprotease protein
VIAVAADGDGVSRAADVLTLGPDEFVDGRMLCFAKNQVTGRYFRLARRESIVLRGVLDGLPHEAISQRCQEITGRPLNENSYREALRVFDNAGMFARTAADEAVDEPLLTTPPTLFTLPLFSWNPDADLDRIVRLWRWLGTPWSFATVSLAILIVEALIFADFHQIMNQALNPMLPLRIAVFLAINGVMYLVHEGAHALVCKSYGGEVREMGFQIRYLIFTPYTRLDDVLLFHSRWKRAAVFLAGPLSSLSILPLAFAGWVLFPADSLGRQASADILIWYNFLFLLQFVPFLQLDGYHIMAQFLRMPHLRQDAYSFIYQSILSWFGKGAPRPVAADVARYVKPIYIIYGVTSFFLTAALLATLIARYSHHLTDWLGPLLGYSLITALLALMLGRFFLELRQASRKVAQ